MEIAAPTANASKYPPHLYTCAVDVQRQIESNRRSPNPSKIECTETAGLSATAYLQPLKRSSTEIYDATHPFLLDVAFSARDFGFPLTPAHS